MSPFQLSFSALCTGIAMVAFTSTIKLSNRNELLTSDVPHIGLHCTYVSGSRKRDLMAQKIFLELLIQSSSTIFEL